jgi:hypothetical protein
MSDLYMIRPNLDRNSAGYQFSPQKHDYTKYIDRDATPSHHGWAWIIIIILIILVLIFIYFFDVFSNAPDISGQNPEEYGTYTEPIIGTCTGTNICTDPGTRAVVRNCIPNPNTGRGCIIPSGPNQGEQSYETLLEVQTCQPHCVASKWQRITADEPCIIEDIDINQCVPSGTTGIRRKNYQCVTNDTTGTNQCTAYQFETTLIGDSTADLIQSMIHGTQQQYVLRTYNIGDIVNIDQSCNDYQNPICGEWNRVIPEPPNYPIPVTSDVQISPCTLNSQLAPVENCIVNANTTITDFLREGYFIEPLSCVYTEDGQEFAITPVDTSLQCPVLSPPSCIRGQITSNEIIYGTLPEDMGQVITTVCAGSDMTPNTNNPTCYQTCRLFASDSITTGKFITATNPSIGIILDKLLSIRWSTGEFLSLKHIPCDLPDRKVFATCDANPGDKLFNVPAMAIPSNAKPGCTAAQVEFDTALMMMIGFRSYDSTTQTVLGQLLSLIGASYLGWLSTAGTRTKTATLLWRQAYDIYQGFGIASTNPSASNYIIEVIRSFSPIPPAGFPEGTLGTIGLSIRSSTNQSINIPALNGSLSLDDVDVVVYDPNVVMFESRNISPSSCNILYST